MTPGLDEKIEIRKGVGQSAETTGFCGGGNSTNSSSQGAHSGEAVHSLEWKL